MVTAVYGDTGLKKTQIYAIIKYVKEGKLTSDQRKSNGTRKIRSPAFITDRTGSAPNSQATRAGARGVKNTIHHTLKEDLNLSTKSARWVSHGRDEEGESADK